MTAPIAAGIFALILSDVPTLNWRTLMHLVVETAVPFANQSGNKHDWQKSAQTGRSFSHYFGFGKIDAYALLMAARKRANVGKHMEWKSGWTVENIALAPESGASVTIRVPAQAEMRTLEHVVLTLSITGTVRGSIQVELKSPTGIVSHLLNTRSRDIETMGIEAWSMSTVAHWGDPPEGEWTLRVTSTTPDAKARGVLTGYALKLLGESTEPDILDPKAPPHLPPEHALGVRATVWRRSATFFLLCCVFAAAVRCCFCGRGGIFTSGGKMGKALPFLGALCHAPSNALSALRARRASRRPFFPLGGRPGGDAGKHAVHSIFESPIVALDAAFIDMSNEDSSPDTAVYPDATSAIITGRTSPVARGQQLQTLRTSVSPIPQDSETITDNKQSALRGGGLDTGL